MFQFAPRKMVEVEPSHQLLQDTCRLPSEEIYRNNEIQSLSSTSSEPSSPLVILQGVIEPDSPLSPPIVRTQSYDVALFDLRKVQADKIAAQLTLIDLELFKAIRMQELADVNWTRKEKARLAPNVMSFTQRFNHTSFWVVREILNNPTAKVRAELLVQFIKISKKLFDLNNIHSLKAVLGGLQSGPIFRLTQTWKLVGKKDKATFERLADFLSPNENWKILRAHMDEAKLPCIPHLGLYLTDLNFLHCTPAASRKEDSIRNIIAYFQNSTYGELVPELHVQKYLLHKRYIDELQKFHEDENYKLSQEREPDPFQFNKPRSSSSAVTNIVHRKPLRTSKSFEDILSPLKQLDGIHTTTRQNSENTSHRVGTASQIVVTDTSSETSHSPVKKVSTLPSSYKRASPLKIDLKNSKPNTSRFHSAPSETGTNLLSPVDITERRSVVTVSPGLRRKFSRGHKKASSLGSNVLQMLGVVKHSNKSPTNSTEASPRSSPTHSLSLIDDTPLEPVGLERASPAGSIGNLSITSESSIESDTEEEALYRKLEDVDEVVVDYMAARLVMEGPLKRKIMNKGSKKVSFGRHWSKVWVQLTDLALLFFPAKQKNKKMDKVIRTKGLVLTGWGVKHKDEKNNDKCFIIYNNSSGSHMKFKANTALTAQTWVERIALVISGEEERERRNAEKSLITL